MDTRENWTSRPVPEFNPTFSIGDIVIAPYGKAEILMIVGPRSDQPWKEIRYSILYRSIYGSGKAKSPAIQEQEWRWESELRLVT